MCLETGKPAQSASNDRKIEPKLSQIVAPSTSRRYTQKIRDLHRASLDFFHYLRKEAAFIESVPIISACRDPKDDKFLALAVTGHADFILSGDDDLLIMHPFRDIDILNPRQYLDRQQT